MRGIFVDSVVDAHSPVGRTLLGKLKVIRQLGAGGMGAVYEVEHLLTGHRRALKLLHGSGAHSHDVVARFAREARVSATVGSPYIVETYDAGTLEDGSPYVLMELLAGKPLSDVLRGGTRLEPARMQRLVGQACEGLGAAHAVGVVHRDIKPDNLFVANAGASDERVRILDFGISKFSVDLLRTHEAALTGEGHVLGTPYYMSPEQTTGATDIDARTDVYSLGVLMYEALSGTRPFDAESLTALAVKIFEGDCVPLSELRPELSPSLLAVVQRAMHRRREERYPDAAALGAALASAGVAVQQPPIEPTGPLSRPMVPPVPYSEPPAPRRRPLRAVGLLVAAVCTAGLGGLLALGSLGRPAPASTSAARPPAAVTPPASSTHADPIPPVAPPDADAAVTVTAASPVSDGSAPPPTPAGSGGEPTPAGSGGEHRERRAAKTTTAARPIRPSAPATRGGALGRSRLGLEREPPP